jgi:hypothetical protein
VVFCLFIGGEFVGGESPASIEVGFLGVVAREKLLVLF